MSLKPVKAVTQKMKVMDTVNQLQTLLEIIWAKKFPYGSVPDSLMSKITEIRNEVNKIKE